MPARKVKSLGREPRNDRPARHRVLIGTPTLGTVRIEWHNAVHGLVIPTNWAQSAQTPIGFLVEDAQNIICHEAMSKGFDWVLLLEDDVIPPQDLFQRLRPYMDHAKYPLVAGLYSLKTIPPEPMIYRGRGNGPFVMWKPGEAVACDGLPTGCTLIHTKLIRAVAEHRNDTYTVRVGAQTVPIRRVFHTPREVWQDPKTGSYKKLIGTSDLDFCDYVLEHGLLAKAGWKALAKREYPYIVDTAIACGHIDRDSGRMF